MTRGNRALKQGGASALDAVCESDLRGWITEHLGIVVQDHQINTLQQAIREGCGQFGFDHCGQYTAEIAAGNKAVEEHLIAAITVGESYFFRDDRQFALLRNRLLPELIERKRECGEFSLRVWSAGCSNGQEVYSLAILLDQLLVDRAAWSLHLLGTDINTGSLSKAFHGRFGSWSMRATPDGLRERYFKKSGEDFELIPQIRRQVQFSYLNLTNDDFPSILTGTNAIDLILCRNVFIYLTPSTVHTVMTKFSASLQMGGLLLLGASDIPSKEIRELKLEQLDGQFYFRRVMPDMNEQASAVSPKMGTQRERQYERKRVDRPTRSPRHEQRTPIVDTPPIEHLEKLAALGDWHRIVEECSLLPRQEKPSSVVLQLQAKALANLGRLDEADRVCRESVEADPLDKHAYLLQSMILSELGQDDAAEKALRQAIYLDLKMAEAHYQLGLLLIRKGSVEAGLNSLDKALKISEQADRDRPVHDGQGMTYGRLAEILRNEIHLYALGNDMPKPGKAATRHRSTSNHVGRRRL